MGARRKEAFKPIAETAGTGEDKGIGGYPVTNFHCTSTQAGEFASTGLALSGDSLTRSYTKGMDYRQHIVRDPEIRFGKPLMKRTRIAVSDILGHLAAGDETDDILGEFPQISREDVLACLAYAADRQGMTRIA